MLLLSRSGSGRFLAAGVYGASEGLRTGRRSLAHGEALLNVMPVCWPRWCRSRARNAAVRRDCALVPGWSSAALGQY